MYRKNWKVILCFELFFKLTLAAILLPLSNVCLDVILKISGFSYLTTENAVKFLFSPLTLLVILVFLILWATISMVDLSAVVYAMDQSRQGTKVQVWDITRFAFKNALNAWKTEFSSVSIIVMLLLPLLKLGALLGVLGTFSVSEFILDVYDENRVAFLAILGAIALIVILMIRWIYAFHYYTLEGASCIEAVKKSAKLSKGKRLTDNLVMLLTQVGFAIGYFLVLVVFLWIASGVARLLGRWFETSKVTGPALFVAVLLALILEGALSAPISFGMISVLYYRRKKEAGEEIVHLPMEAEISTEKLRHYRRRYGLFGGLILAASVGVGYLVTTGMINPKAENIHAAEVTAHRGASGDFPENTMAAFRGAVDLGADWIELDVQQTKDRQVIVMHDTNTKRTAGLDANTWELTYDEIAKLDAGNGERIPLLTEVIEFAKENNIRLNIEIKPTKYDKNLEKDVVDIVRGYDFADKCLVASQSYKSVEAVKAYDPSITTLFVMSLAYGDITSFKAADHYSVKSTFITKALTARVHAEGKQIFAWTVNKESSINKMLDKNVDSVITNNVATARKCVELNRYGGLLSRYVRILFNAGN
ncbi:MAG: glycerophosphoryl diester phosphodiesterase membrane domain-containing protein [Lachnospiraceae bacterium]|nr:glycerophosphoryl diester phosphodiesterase membrane domain-containing protein [Lachnospiraceae bacterium]